MNRRESGPRRWRAWRAEEREEPIPGQEGRAFGHERRVEPLRRGDELAIRPGGVARSEAPVGEHALDQGLHVSRSSRERPLPVEQPADELAYPLPDHDPPQRATADQ